MAATILRTGAHIPGKSGPTRLVIDNNSDISNNDIDNRAELQRLHRRRVQRQRLVAARAADQADHAGRPRDRHEAQSAPLQQRQHVIVLYTRQWRPHAVLNEQQNR